jgi:hypothetical protein
VSGTNLHSSGRPSLRPGTPGGSSEASCKDEEPIAVAIAQHPVGKHPVGTQAYVKYVEECDSAASCKDEETTKVCE